MTQATTSSFPTPLPANADPTDYPLPHVPRGPPQPITKPAVSAFPGTVDCWPPSSQGAMSLFSFVGSAPPADAIGSSYEFLGFDGTFPDSSLPNNDLLNSHFRPYLDTSTEEPEASTAVPDLKFDANSLQIGAQPRPPLSYPFSTVPLEKPGLESNLFPPRADLGPRRSSAPSLNVRDLERERTQKLKHQNRRASHNVVEKRYRENLNRKFHLLETIVNKGTEPYSCSPCPSPRSSPSSSGSRKGNTTFSSSSSSSARRQYTSPKATIIDSALSYIESLRSENHALKGRLFFYETSNNPCLRGRPQGQTAAQEYDQDDDSGSDSDDGDEEMSGVKSEERQ
ncbi:uncharacterized protein BDW70DRAFT_12423 [Aspergillus foveolatus]|uniref:uncharacterized protein n=1 Tax=Aspergillus foveolatus TaxID=210207 RepID=UPI003CCE4AD7